MNLGIIALQVSLVLLAAADLPTPLEPARLPTPGESLPHLREYTVRNGARLRPQVVRFDESSRTPIQIGVAVEVAGGDAYLSDPYMTELGSGSGIDLFACTLRDGNVDAIVAVKVRDERKPSAPREHDVRNRTIVGRRARLEINGGKGVQVPHFAQLFLRRGFCGERRGSSGPDDEPYVGCSDPLYLGMFPKGGQVFLDLEDVDGGSDDSSSSAHAGLEDGSVIDASAWTITGDDLRTDVAVVYVNLTSKPLRVFDPFLRAFANTDFPGMLYVHRSDNGWMKDLSPGRRERIGSYIIPSEGMYEDIPANCLAGGVVRVADRLDPGKYVIELALDERAVKPEAWHATKRGADVKTVVKKAIMFNIRGDN